MRVNRINICRCHDLPRLLLMMIFCMPVSWYAIFAPARTPRDGAARINADVKLVLRPE
jgi:hypothetical protein